MRMQSLLGASVALLLSVSAAAAEPLYSFDSTPGKLPKSVVPIHYTIELAPDLQALSIAGSETVEIDVREPVSRVVLNAVNTEIADASIDDGAQRAEVSLDAKAETATLTFANALTTGAHKLRLNFKARINSFGRGMFYADYPTDSGSKRMLSTQLEPSDARRIFPCWDEPAFKATFALTVTVPNNFLAVSNMPVTRRRRRSHPTTSASPLRRRQRCRATCSC